MKSYIIARKLQLVVYMQDWGIFVVTYIPKIMLFIFNESYDDHLMCKMNWLFHFIVSPDHTCNHVN